MAHQDFRSRISKCSAEPIKKIKLQLFLYYTKLCDTSDRRCDQGNPRYYVRLDRTDFRLVVPSVGIRAVKLHPLSYKDKEGIT